MQEKATLLAWFDGHKRDLPWRSPGGPTDPPPDSYAVWVSEIMLQQTRVETAIPYYRRFLARFPDVASLARADEAEVLALWSGLGYYRRCRGLLATAKAVVAAGGRLPSRARELERLPGIGPYTAAAIASIAFSEAVPVLDGNVERVLCRYAARSAGAAKRGERAALLELAASFLDRNRPGDSNQALMELGATVCTPRAPRCPVCPLTASCRARAQGTPESYPALAKRASLEKVRQIVVFVEAEGRLLLFRRSAAARQLAALWEFPAVELEDLRAPLAAEARLSERFGGRWRLGAEIVRLRHAITTRSYTIVVRRAEFEIVRDELAEGAGAGNGGGSEPGWWSRTELAGLPLTGVARKLLARVEAQPG
ncbi:MAG: A/G-specific adenine glycosylase [Thermoanaerobaculia bacterium]